MLSCERTSGKRLDSISEELGRMLSGPVELDRAGRRTVLQMMGWRPELLRKNSVKYARDTGTVI